MSCSEVMSWRDHSVHPVEEHGGYGLQSCQWKGRESLGIVVQRSDSNPGNHQRWLGQWFDLKHDDNKRMGFIYAGMKTCKNH